VREMQAPDAGGPDDSTVVGILRGMDTPRVLASVGPDLPAPPVPEGSLRVSVVIPTLNEAENIDRLLAAVLENRSPSLDIEVLVVDDGSQDTTRERVRAWERRSPVRLVEREGERGLASAVLAGAAAAAGEVVVVMDADLSHPPPAIPELARPIGSGAADMVIGSRYVKGGALQDWPLSRKIISRAAAALTRLLTGARDPLSGFFAVRRERLLEIAGRPQGFKIGLEVLARGGEELRVLEVPITFQNRAGGRSKFGPGVARAYLRRLLALTLGEGAAETLERLFTAALIGLGADLFLFQLLLGRVGLGAAQLASFAAGLLVTSVLLSRKGPEGELRQAPWGRRLSFLAGCLLGCFLRGGVLAVLSIEGGWSPRAAILPALLVSGAAVLVGGGLFLVVRPPRDPALRWRVLAVAVLIYAFLLRLVYLGLPDLIPEEAYYWNYSRHLDLGYLDHPPLVAWLVRLGGVLLGHGELAVRIGALLSALGATVFVYLLARNLHGRTAGFRAVLLMAVLPFFFTCGLLMMPDAPLVAAWAGTLYFLERALRGGSRAAWLWAGLCLGVGLLSKYTILLLCPAALLLLVLDRSSRRWLRSSLPYGALLLALLLFLPVIVWNYRHDWASFRFQGPRRLAEPLDFSLLDFLGSLFLLLTPPGLITVVVGLLKPPPVNSPPAETGGGGQPRGGTTSSGGGPTPRLFAAVLTLVPVGVFAVFSLFHPAKHSWSGPAWLAALPAAAAWMGAPGSGPGPRPAAFLRWLWGPLIAGLLIFYSGALHFLVLGLPGLRYSERIPLAMNWRELGRQVGMLRDEVRVETGEEPLVLGMDKYDLSSELAFYGAERGLAATTAGRHLFGFPALMYELWFPLREQLGKSLVVVAYREDQILRLQACSERWGPLRQLLIRKGRDRVGRCFAAVAYRFRGCPAKLE
jgi:dolichol-phosphate mannosyltransferase